MGRPVLGLALRERLGTDGSSALVDYVENCGDTWKREMMTELLTREHFDLRMQAFVTKEHFDLRTQAFVTKDEFAAFRVEMAREFSDVRGEVRQALGEFRQDVTRQFAGQRVELLRWSFLFWIGQVAATAGLISLALHLNR